MTRFGEKLDQLNVTADMLRGQDLNALAAALRATRGRRTTVVASGGSVVPAHFLARCRETLFGEPTTIVTPMEIVLGGGDLDRHSVWIISAGADNPDTVAAVLAAQARGASDVAIITRNPAGAALAALGQGGGVHLVPVADHKDGFLATHSLVSTVGALLIASDLASEDPVGSGISERWGEAVRKVTSPDMRSAHAVAFAGLCVDHTVLLAADPRAAGVAVLLDTSIWEAALCSVQRTDLRNFAHGRHALLHHRPDQVRLLALTGVESRETWLRIDRLVPGQVARSTVDLGDCGRYRNAVGIVDALGIVEAIGRAVGIDPGKPGIADFGRELYSDDSLLGLARALSPCIRQKRDALASRGDPEFTEIDSIVTDAERRSSLAGAPVGGIVLDYDGTIVSTADRYELPSSDLVAEIIRLKSAGVEVAIATGRGGSAGEDLRRVLPEAMHASVLVGYYNGGHVVPLSVDLRAQPPTSDEAVASAGAALGADVDLASRCRLKVGAVQITITPDRPGEIDQLLPRIEKMQEVLEGKLRVARSGHSIDVVVARASKMTVVEALRARMRAGHQILTFGDSGARGGNDCELLSREFGISVGTVCGRAGGSHSLFGTRIIGPQALVKVLGAIRRTEDGDMCLNLPDLHLDNVV